MAVSISSSYFSGQTADVTLYLPTGTTIPYTSATTVNIGSKVMPFTYQGDYPAWEYGVFSLYFSGSGKTCIDYQSTPPDGDGNVYRTIQIGNQIWMSENLKTTKFQDGTPLSNTSQVSNATWAAATASNKYWALVNGTTANTQTYGLVYNNFAITGSTSGSTASTNLCPAGYHIPTTAEFNTLKTFLGGNNSAGTVKHPGTIYWVASNVGATNTSGFSAIGNGLRSQTGSYSDFRFFSVLWNTDIVSNLGLTTNFYSDDTVWDSSNFDQRIGAGVRCLKD